MKRLKLRFSNPVEILRFSSGEVTDPKTINFRSGQPIPGGLFCQKIFGSIKDYTCGCVPPQLSGKEHKGMTCSQCGVTLTQAKVRRERIGHICFPVPVLHPLAEKITAQVLNISPLALHDVVHAKIWIGIEFSKNGDFVVHDGGEYKQAKCILKDVRSAEAFDQSASAVYNIVRRIDLLRTMELHEGSNTAVAKFLKKAFYESFDLTRLFIQILPVLPPAMRPLLNMGHFYTGNQKNDIYSNLIWKKFRYESLLEHPYTNLKTILENEASLLQLGVEKVLYSGARIKGKFVPSLLHDLSGKEGHIRAHLLGKRVDYSARTVVSPGPYLKLDEAGIPRKIAYVLFRPFIIKRLLETVPKLNARKVHRFYMRQPPEAWSALEEVVKGRRIILNRQPTLHRVGMLSFKILLHDGNTTLLHPMVCAPYNADFDGDQMAIHLPMFEAAQQEVKTLLDPIQNLLSPLDGSPLIAPSHEMIIGAYYMTKMEETSPRYVKSKEQVLELYNLNVIKVNTPVMIYQNGEGFLTCPGRLLLGEILGEVPSVPVTKKEIKTYLENASLRLSNDELVDALEKIKEMTFSQVTRIGFSVGMDDIKSPSIKEEVFAEVDSFIANQISREESGEISSEELYESRIRAWLRAIDHLNSVFIEEAGETNPVVVMLRTGARVKASQVSQLAVTKGMQATSSGKILPFPVRPSLKEGLTAFEYFQTASGARKSMSDKKTATPLSGYLARRLVTMCRDFYISEGECSYVGPGISLPKKNAVGRTTLQGELICNNSSDEFVKVRSPVFCAAKRGICATCYGIDKVTRKQVKLGTPVGVIAGQSLTEPTTQLSVAHEEEVLVQRDGVIERARIGDLVDDLLDCLPVVRTYDGWEISDVSLLNITVPSMTKEGKMIWAPLQSVERHPSPKTLYKVVTRTGKSATVTGAHCHFTLDTNGKIVTAATDSLLKGSRIAIVGKFPEAARTTTLTGLEAYNVSGRVHLLPSELNLTFDLGWFFGVYVAEGSCTKSDISISNVTPEIRERVKTIFPEWVHDWREYKREQKILGSDKTYAGIDTKITSQSLSRFLQDNFGTGSACKRLPGWMYSTPNSFISGFLSGYLDGDGNINESRTAIRAHSISKKLLYDMSLLLTRLGVISKVYKTRSVNGSQKPVYELYVSFDNAKKLCHHISPVHPDKKERVSWLKTKAPYIKNDHLDSVCGLQELLISLTKKVNVASRDVNHKKHGRKYLRRQIRKLREASLQNNIDISEELQTLTDIAWSDVVWDEVVEVRKVSKTCNYVYDFSVPGTESFILANGIIEKNTMRSFHTSGVAELGETPLTVKARQGGVIKVSDGNPISSIHVGDDQYLVHTRECNILVEDFEEVTPGTSLAVYTSKDLLNEDISNKLGLLEYYYEVFQPKADEAVIARSDGIISLAKGEDGTIDIYVNGELQGGVTNTPVFVHDGEKVYFGQFLSYGEAYLNSLADNIHLAATVFVQRVLELYQDEEVNPNPVHLEIVFRGMSDLVVKEDGEIGILSQGDLGRRLVLGATELGKKHPSWLRSISFGYVRSRLQRAAIGFETTYDLPSERLMVGSFPLFDVHEKENDNV
jgi:DNA-directed RNA polymerase subunit beta'